MHLEVIEAVPESAGHRAPILFVHGMWHAAWCWTEHFLPYFAQHGYTSYALSLQGHGNSDGRERLRWTSMADYVSNIEQVACRFQRRPVLVGHSMGGMAVQKYLESREAPAAVLMASVPPAGVARTTLRFAWRHPPQFVKSILTLSLTPVVSTPRLAREVLFSPAMPDEKVNRYFSLLQEDSFRAYLDMLVPGLPGPHHVRIPVLVLGAAGDGLISRSEVEATAHAYETRAEIIPDMAHDLMLENGWRRAADLILDWLKAQGL